MFSIASRLRLVVDQNQDTDSAREFSLARKTGPQTVAAADGWIFS
jgi:hypothetical protein